MSQWGMVAHWRRVGGPKVRRSLAINGLGAVATSATVVVVIVSKFMEGAWITLLVIPLFMWFFRSRAARTTASIRPSWTRE